ncbi:MAG: hypothetical protein AB7J34_02340, partial [Limisphaerales bacterium]
MDRLLGFPPLVAGNGFRDLNGLRIRVRLDPGGHNNTKLNPVVIRRDGRRPGAGCRKEKGKTVLT